MSNIKQSRKSYEKDYIRIRDYFYAITPDPKKYFFGLMEVEHE